MNISVMGAGYVGLSTALGFAKKSHTVVCYDVSKEVVERINRKEPAFYEPLAGEMLQETVSRGMLKATQDLEYAVQNSDVTFVCVPTPSNGDGSIDLSYIKQACVSLGKALSGKDYHVVAIKSTVLPQTTESIALPELEKASGKECGKGFGLCVNPEFLREGSALRDFLKPDRVVIGEFDRKSGDVLESLYMDFGCPIIRTGIKTAEMIKYASNAFLASKVSLTNEIGNICKKLGIDVYDVMLAVGMDRRISPHFLDAGIGFGGSCFPKDVNALIDKSRGAGIRPSILESVMETNRSQPLKLVEMLKKRGDIKGKKVCLLGLAFKPNTDDIREAPSLVIVKNLLEEGAHVKAYDPKAMGRFRERFPQITYCASAHECLRGSDACLILTEWDEFRNLENKDFNVMGNKIVIEGRKVLDPKKADFEGICW